MDTAPDGQSVGRRLDPDRARQMQGVGEGRSLLIRQLLAACSRIVLFVQHLLVGYLVECGVPGGFKKDLQRVIFQNVNTEYFHRPASSLPVYSTDIAYRRFDLTGFSAGESSMPNAFRWLLSRLPW